MRGEALFIDYGHAFIPHMHIGADQQAFESFRFEYSESYETLDVKLAGLTEWERRIGAFPSE